MLWQSSLSHWALVFLPRKSDIIVFILKRCYKDEINDLLYLEMSIKKSIDDSFLPAKHVII